MFAIFLILAIAAGCCSAFTLPMSRKQMQSRTQMQMMQPTELATSFLTAVAKDPNYEYGAVAAPDFVLPLGAVLVILTAGIAKLRIVLSLLSIAS
jgi:hypothetical protein